MLCLDPKRKHKDSFFSIEIHRTGFFIPFKDCLLQMQLREALFKLSDETEVEKRLKSKAMFWSSTWFPCWLNTLVWVTAWREECYLKAMSAEVLVLLVVSSFFFAHWKEIYEKKWKKADTKPIINTEAFLTQPVSQVCKPDPGSEGPFPVPCFLAFPCLLLSWEARLYLSGQFSLRDTAEWDL